jgi:hypothetical protein
VTAIRDGGVFVAPQVPVNPDDVEAPAAGTPLWAASVTVTDDPDRPAAVSRVRRLRGCWVTE